MEITLSKNKPWGRRKIGQRKGGKGKQEFLKHKWERIITWRTHSREFFSLLLIGLFPSLDSSSHLCSCMLRRHYGCLHIRQHPYLFSLLAEPQLYLSHKERHWSILEVCGRSWRQNRKDRTSLTLCQGEWYYVWICSLNIKPEKPSEIAILFYPWFIGKVIGVQEVKKTALSYMAQKCKSVSPHSRVYIVLTRITHFL